jgi:hypothetical protein
MNIDKQIELFEKQIGGPGSAPVEDLKKELPFDQRLADKNWKVRKSAYEDLQSNLKKNLAYDALDYFSDYSGSFENIADEANGATLDSGLDLINTILGWIASNKKNVSYDFDVLVKKICEKVLNQSRVIIKKKGAEILKS